MQRRRGAIESDIGRDHAGLRARIQRLGLRHLVNEAALGQDVEKIGFIRTHSWVLGQRLVACVGGWCNRSAVGFNNAWRRQAGLRV